QWPQTLQDDHSDSDGRRRAEKQLAAARATLDGSHDRGNPNEVLRALSSDHRCARRTHQRTRGPTRARLKEIRWLNLKSKTRLSSTSSRMRPSAMALAPGGPSRKPQI